MYVPLPNVVSLCQRSAETRRGKATAYKLGLRCWISSRPPSKKMERIECGQVVREDVLIEEPINLVSDGLGSGQIFHGAIVNTRASGKAYYAFTAPTCSFSFDKSLATWTSLVDQRPVCIYISRDMKAYLHSGSKRGTYPHVDSTRGIDFSLSPQSCLWVWSSTYLPTPGTM